MQGGQDSSNYYYYLTGFAAGSRKLNLGCFCAPCLFGQVVLVKRKVVDLANSLSVRASPPLNKA